MTDSDLQVDDIRPFVGTHDFDASRDFYVALGWRVTYDSDTLRVLELENHRFYLQNFYNKVWCENTMLHVAVKNVEAWYAFAKQRFAVNTFGGDARLSDAPRDEGYAKVFYIWDPAGVLLHIAQFAEA